MAYQTVSSEGWLSRIGNSIKGIVVGGLLFIVAFPVLFWNEGRAVHRSQDLSEGKGAVKTVEAASPSAGNDGKLVLFNGKATADGALHDEEFGISSQNAIRLIRSAEMYQWRENTKKETRKKLGGGEETVTTYTYDKGWEGKLIDSDHFNHDTGNTDSRGKVNPGVMALKDGTTVTSKEMTAEKVTVGGFTVPQKLVGSISKVDVLPSAEITEGKLGGLKISDNKYYSADPVDPKIGDVRLGFSAVKPQDVTVLGKQQGTTLTDYTTKAGGTLIELRTGLMDAQAFFSKLEAENTMMTWILRLAGFVVMAIGIGMILKPIQVLADVVPFIGDLAGIGIGVAAIMMAGALSLLTIALGWVVYRPLVGIGLLVVSGALFYGLRTMRKNRKAARLAAA